MARVVTTNYFRQMMATQQIDLSGDSFAVALMNIHVQSADTSALKEVSAWSDVSANEASAVGYSAVNISSPSVSVIDGNIVSWDGTDISWSSITLSPYGYCIYRINDGLVVGFVEFTAGQINAVNGSITIQWNSGGIMNII